MARAIALALCVAALAGCGGSSGAKSNPDERIIRGWSRAVNAGQFDRAADYFAPGAVVIQSEIYELDTHAQAVAWNSGLPCRADVTFVRAEEGGTTLAGFHLRTGRTGECRQGGNARVRFTIKSRKIRVWHQLPEGQPKQLPPGESA